MSSKKVVSSEQIVLAFDVYGTLLSTESIAQQLHEMLGPSFEKEEIDVIAKEWRKYQLEYTWRLNSMSWSPGSPTLHQTSNSTQINMSHSPK